MIGRKALLLAHSLPTSPAYVHRRCLFCGLIGQENDMGKPRVSARAGSCQILFAFLLEEYNSQTVSGKKQKLHLTSGPAAVRDSLYPAPCQGPHTVHSTGV